MYVKYQTRKYAPDIEILHCKHDLAELAVW